MIGLPQSSVPTTTHCGLRRREFASLPASDEEGGLCDVGYCSLELNISDQFFYICKKLCVHPYVEVDGFFTFIFFSIQIYVLAHKLPEIYVPKRRNILSY